MKYKILKKWNMTEVPRCFLFMKNIMGGSFLFKKTCKSIKIFLGFETPYCRETLRVSGWGTICTLLEIDVQNAKGKYLR